jgi:hypothetical protein
VKRPPAGDAPLPVDVARLRQQFPALTDEDVQAYVAVTRRIVAASASDRARITRETLARARAARSAAPGDEDDRLALRYLTAVEKMQGH